MKIIAEHLNGLKIVQLDIFKDNRGFFSERYSAKKFHQIGLPINFVQDNFSRSQAGVVRGLHYQKSPDQAKLVGCLSGKILDVAIDIRISSPSFGKYFAIELSDENGLMLYIPAGFAHGFSALTNADVIYKVDGDYNKSGEGGIIFNDPVLNIDWGIKYPIVSEKDLQLQNFTNYSKKPAF